LFLTRNRRVALTTLSDKSFIKFKRRYRKRFPNRTVPSTYFLQWLIGFSEGDGCFTQAKRGDLSFVITQNKFDKQVLTFILFTLSFGIVIVQSTQNNTYRYVRQKIRDFYLIILIFNGNIVFPTRNARFMTFLRRYNEKALCTELPQITPNMNTNMPSLNDSWLAGITDREGCFSISFLTKQFNIVFVITQRLQRNKRVLEHLVKLFAGGKVLEHHIKDVWEYRLYSLKNTKLVFPYFDKVCGKLFTKKANSYILWKELHGELILKNHLNPSLILQIKLKSKLINKIGTQEEVGENSLNAKKADASK